MSDVSLKRVFTLLAVIVFLPGATVAWGGKIAPELFEKLQSGASGQQHTVIIKLADRVDMNAMSVELAGFGREERQPRVVRTLRRHAESSQQGVRTYLEERKTKGQARDIRPFWIFNGIAVTADAATIQVVAELPEVEAVVPVHIYRLATPVPVSAAVPTPGWNIDKINVNPLWSKNIKGAGQVVANLDTGVDINNAELVGKWRGGANSWFDPNNEHATPFDKYGHGTQVMGVMVGGSLSDSPIGVAPDARWIAAKIFDDAGNADGIGIHASFQWALDPDGNPATADAPDVVNCSWDLEPISPDTLPLYDEVFRQDIQLLKAAGIAVVFAAGNGGPAGNTSTSPANYPETLSAGSTDVNDNVSWFSSRGPTAAPVTAFTGVGLPYDPIFPLLTAPGEQIRTADLTQNGTLPNSYTTVSGTSFASPHVAGAITLLNSAISGLTVAQAEFALKHSVLGPNLPNNDFGYGRLDVGKAYAYLSMPGDVNGDVKVDVVDALIVLKASVGAIQIAPGGLIANNGNVTYLVTGGTKATGVPTIQDALYILQKAVGLTPF